MGGACSSMVLVGASSSSSLSVCELCVAEKHSLSCRSPINTALRVIQCSLLIEKNFKIFFRILENFSTHTELSPSSSLKISVINFSLSRSTQKINFPAFRKSIALGRKQHNFTIKHLPV